MKKMNNKLTLIALCTLLFAACKKDETKMDENTVQSKSQSNLVADASITGGHFAFYSLANNEAVPFTDSATTKWDIAFRGTTILANAGSSGPGVGGAFVQTAVSYSNYATISADSTFKVDAAPVYAITGGSGKGWYNYDATTNIIAPIPGRILIIRTATGKYAKLEILSYYKDAPASPTGLEATRYYTFRYQYQANGSKNF